MVRPYLKLIWHCEAFGQDLHSLVAREHFALALVEVLRVMFYINPCLYVNLPGVLLRKIASLSLVGECGGVKWVFTRVGLLYFGES